MQQLLYRHGGVRARAGGWLHEGLGQRGWLHREAGHETKANWVGQAGPSLKIKTQHTRQRQCSQTLSHNRLVVALRATCMSCGDAKSGAA